MKSKQNEQDIYISDGMEIMCDGGDPNNPNDPNNQPPNQDDKNKNFRKNFEVFIDGREMERY